MTTPSSSPDSVHVGSELGDLLWIVPMDVSASTNIPSFVRLIGSVRPTYSVNPFSRMDDATTSVVPVMYSAPEPPEVDKKHQ